MKKIALVVLACASLTSAGCSILPGAAFDVGVCTAGKLAPKIAEIKAKVYTCIQTSNYGPCLDFLAKEVGPDIVLCAVREFTGVGATPTTDPNARERARAYLDSKGVKS